MKPAARRMLEALRSSGVKLTEPRRAIVEGFAGDLLHPTAQELFERVRRSQPKISFATVYNTLAMLREAGLCREVDVRGGPTRFDPILEPHHHAICDACRDVMDIPAGNLRAPMLHGFRVTGVELIYRGLCDRCAAPRAERGSRTKKLRSARASAADEQRKGVAKWART